MKKTVLLFVFDGYADWEPSYALAGIAGSKAFCIKTISIDKSPVKSMGGISLLPDLDFFPNTDLKDIDHSNTALLILPGGTAWEEGGNRLIGPLVSHCLRHGIPVAAICGATLFLADGGWLDEMPHTSNDLGYLEAFSSTYQGYAHYREIPVVTSGAVITASGTAAIEFAGAVFDILEIEDHDFVKPWFRYFQNKAVNFMPDAVVG